MAMSSNYQHLNSGIKSNNEIGVDHNRCDDREGIFQKRRWSREEDIWLINYVENNGPQNWRKIASKLKRTSKSCRLRWFNQLSPDISHEPFTAKEDEIIIDMVHTIGGKWSRIARVLKGRTDNQIKNQWHSRLEKMKGRRAPQQLPKRKLTQTANRKAKPTHGNLNGSCPAPRSFSAPLLISNSTSAGPVYHVPPPATLHVSPPYPPAGSLNSHLLPAFDNPYPPAPAPAFSWPISLSLWLPSYETSDAMFPDLFPDPSAFYPTQVQQCGPLRGFTAMMQEAIASEPENPSSNWTCWFDPISQGCDGGSDCQADSRPWKLSRFSG